MASFQRTVTVLEGNKPVGADLLRRAAQITVFRSPRPRYPTMSCPPILAYGRAREIGRGLKEPL